MCHSFPHHPMDENPLFSELVVKPPHHFFTSYEFEDHTSLLQILRELQLTEEQLIENSFPRWKNWQKTEAVIKPSYFDQMNGRMEFVPDHDTRRNCVRCHAPYRIPIDGKKRIDFCIHHKKPAKKGNYYRYRIIQ
ncbi:hypothetical protein DICVIV_13031 [Dictyocaulus viviparus]|uniref:Uncharacterized protein n=1 Tax=Dictyocaulus viviparus TaxID=29172 RepID=A0A0D8XBH6_DICVI|nr:hypothetical protein DICVIV_13031 [Dictyocaulus viviparus]